MAKKSSYWQEQFESIRKNQIEMDERYIKNMEKDYKRLSKRMYKDLDEWVTKYATNDEITKEEACKLLTKEERRDWQMTLKEFRQKAIDGGYEQELDRIYFKSRITRLEQLQMQLYMQLAEEGGKQREALEKHLSDQLGETYLRSIYTFTNFGRIEVKFARYNERSLRYAVSQPWNGRNFSKSVWGNHLKRLPNKLNKTMSLSIVNGWGIDKTVNEMMKGVDNDLKHRMVTLVQSESAHIAEIAFEKMSKELDIERFEWMATLEVHTCKDCGDLDGEVFQSDDEDAPKMPLHPNCRCVKVPYDDLWERETRWQRDPETGEGLIGKQMTFEEWKKEHNSVSKIKE